MIKLKKVNENQIRHAEWWNQKQMIECYLNSLSQEFMRVMTDHSSQMSCFEICRTITSFNMLLSMIWSQLDVWKSQFDLQIDQINDLAAMKVINLLFYLCEIILQNSVILHQLFSSHSVWNHSVFQHEIYTFFAQEVEACLQQKKKNSSQLSIFYQIILFIINYMKIMNT